MIDTIQISALKDKHDSAPRRSKVPWGKFVDAFRKVRKTTCSVVNCQHNDHAWSPTVYPPSPSRQKPFIAEISLLIVDLDHLTDDQFAAALTPLAPYQRIMHASHMGEEK